MGLGLREIAAASDLLFDHWQRGTRLAALPDVLLPGTRAEGYAIQARLEARSGAPLFGWKIAATSLAGQTHIGVDGPLAGRLLAERVVADGGCASLAGNSMRCAEPEYAFRIGTTLAPRSGGYGIDEVVAAVDTLHPAIELPDSRFEDYVAIGGSQLVADNSCAHMFVLGPATSADWRSVDLAAHRPRVCIAGKPDVIGCGDQVLGDPRIALTWLVNELSGLGLALQHGQVVTTGTCCYPVAVGEGETATADFGVFGRVSVRLV